MFRLTVLDEVQDFIRRHGDDNTPPEWLNQVELTDEKLLAAGVSPFTLEILRDYEDTENGNVPDYPFRRELLEDRR